MAPDSTTADEDAPLAAFRLSPDNESQRGAHPSMAAVIAELESLIESLRREDRGITEPMCLETGVLRRCQPRSS